MEDSTWLDYFDPYAALRSLFAHIESLPSSRTPERHTEKVYKSGIVHFLRFLGGEVTIRQGQPDEYDLRYLSLPTRERMQAYIATLLQDGLKAKTVGCKYLAPARHWIEALNDQFIPRHNGHEYLFVGDCKDQLSVALKTKPPRWETTTNESALYVHGERLTLLEVNTMFQSLNPKTLIGIRDLALIYLGITSGLRIAELQRLTLANISMGETCWEIRVRGKRSNMDPVPIDNKAYELIQKYVAVYNEGLAEDDPRRISREMPIWQRLLHGNNYSKVGVNGFDPAKGITPQGLRDRIHWISRRSIGKTISPHDMRRTAAFLARQAGYGYEIIQMLLRHKSISTTANYVGNPPDRSKALLSNVLHFELPE
jgi:integrase